MSRTTAPNPQTVVLRVGRESLDVGLTFGAGDRLSITVHPDLRITARAPAGQPFDAIVNRIRARAGWIARQRVAFAARHPLPPARRYVSGETHLYLGRQYRLRVRRGSDDQVVMGGGYIHVVVRQPSDTEHVQKVVTSWFRERAKAVLSRRFEACYEKVRTLDIPRPTPVIRCMRTRWGSCTTARRILLNPDLVHVAGYCIDYVIIHELCHLRVLKHDQMFYRLLARYLPDWEHRKRRLDGYVLSETR